MHDNISDANRRILVIDDNPGIHEDFRKILGAGRMSASAVSDIEAALLGEASRPAARPVFEIDSAFQGQEGVTRVAQAQEEHRPYAMAFVDARMPPGWDGIETAARIWAQDPQVQIVICTAYSDHSWEEIQNKLGLSSGLVILKKPFDTIEVLQLASALTEKWRLARQTNQRLQHLQHLTQNDLMTGLPNRKEFRDRLCEAIARTRCHGALTGLLLLDLDDFKGLNQTLGQSVGDLALEQVAERLKQCTRTSDTLVARIGDDEFAVILEGLVDTHAAVAVARRILDALSQPLLVDRKEVSVTASIGISLCPTDAGDLDRLMKNAEVAIHFAKRGGPNNLQVYCPELQARTQHEMSRRVQIDERLARLTPREREVMDLLVAGHTNKAIGQFLDVSPRTVEAHRARVMDKMQVESLQDLVRVVLEVRAS